MDNSIPSEETILRDLQETGILSTDAVFMPLTGGVSCEVWRVRPEHLTPEVVRDNPHGLVVKAPLATLRTPALWQADVSRGFAEAAALTWYGTVTPDAVPKVVWRHAWAPVFVVEAAPEAWEEWRHQMLYASADSPDVAGERLARIGAHLGTTVAAWHMGSRDTNVLPEVLLMGDRLRTLRTDPFHRATATEVPEIAAELRTLAHELESARTCLVHGDFSPKNVLVSAPGSPFGGWMLDAEVAHVGDPVLDVAYLSTHFVCKGVARPALAASFDGARRAFEDAYRTNSDLVDADRWSRHAGAILAARMRGVSRVNYLTPEQQEFVLARAIRLVRGESSLDEVWEQILLAS